MARHLQVEIEHLKSKMLRLGGIVEEAVCLAVKALLEHDTALAAKIVEGDVEIDRMEVDLEEECLKVLALHQPVAGDLRFIVAILKVNGDLERVGDLAVHMAEKAAVLARQGLVPLPAEFPRMAQQAQVMLKISLDALANLNLELAQSIAAKEEEVDALNHQTSKQLKAEMRAHPENLDLLMDVLSVCRNAERIADHATNIAEDAVYLIEGEIVRHRSPEGPVAPGAKPAN